MIYSIDESMNKKFPEKPTEDTLEAELDYSERLVEVIEKEPKLVFIPKIKEPVNLLKETITDDQLELQESPDPDSRLGHKSADFAFFGYKTHLGMSQERIITAATVITGKKTGGKQLPELVKKSQDAGLEVKEVIGDTAYSAKETINYAKENEIELISKSNPSVSHGYLQRKANE